MPIKDKIELLNKFKIMPQKENQQITQKELEKIFNKQTLTILSALDKKTSSLDKKIDSVDIKLSKKIDVMETRFNKKLDRLTTTLDKFLK